jgi:hypothetical protein
MFGTGFKEGDNAEIPIEGTTSAAFKALIKYLYTDSMEVDEVDDAVLFDLAKLCDQYCVDRLYNHCLHQISKGITVQNAVIRLVQAHTTSNQGPMWAKMRTTTMSFVTSNLEGIQCKAMATLEHLERNHPDLIKQELKIKLGFKE